MFETLPLLAPDPILGLSSAYLQDTNPRKVDLGVGVYKDAQGITPIMSAVKKAEHLRLSQEQTKAYTDPAGYPGANRAVTKLIFGEHAVTATERVQTVQTPGGCGALRLAAEFIQRAKPHATIWVSTPTWANHVPLLSSAGLTLKEYPYYDYQHHRIDFDAMMTALNEVPAGDLVLLHACCHNPSGADLNQEQWQKIAELATKKSFIPFIDMAYQGFGEGVEEDAYGIRLLANTVPEVIIATSFSKSFGLYRERAGALSILFADAEQARAGKSQLLSVARGLYSMPPSHGSAILDIILQDAALTQEWLAELTMMRERIQDLRVQLVKALNQQQDQRDFSFIAQERGMFSFLGLSVEQVQRLKKDFSIYMTDSSRINVAGLNAEKIPYVSQAIASVL